MPALRKILYVEDDLDLQAVVELTVRTMSDYEICICENEKLFDCSEEYNPDLILLDVMMPVVDALTVFKNLQNNEKTKNISVIVMVTKAQVHEAENLLKNGVIGIITKPFDPLELCSDIKKIWCKSLEDKTTDPSSCCSEVENIWKCDEE